MSVSGACKGICFDSAPVETSAGYIGRSTLDKPAEDLSLHGEDRTIPEIDRTCFSAARPVPAAIRRQLTWNAAVRCRFRPRL